jgi:hypothetical protein
MDAALWWRKLIATAIVRSLAVYAARDDSQYFHRLLSTWRKCPAATDVAMAIQHSIDRREKLFGGDSL